MIVIKSDRTIEPFGIKMSRESSIALMASSETANEEVNGYNGEIDFGATLKNNEYEIQGIIEHPDNINRQKAIDYVVAKFIECMGPTELTYEAIPNIFTYARVTGNPDFIPYPSFTRITFNLRINPFWYGVTEKSLTGNGTLINDGTFETGLIIEIAGPAVSPSLSIGNDTLSYQGTINEGQTLVIDTEKQTVKVGNNNANNKYNKVFPLLPPGEINITATDNITIRWRDKWI